MDRYRDYLICIVVDFSYFINDAWQVFNKNLSMAARVKPGLGIMGIAAWQAIKVLKEIYEQGSTI